MIVPPRTAPTPTTGTATATAIAVRWTAVVLVAAALWIALDLRSTLAHAVDRIDRTADGLRIDPRSATAAEFELIPGIGPATAGRIVAHRLDHGADALLVEDEDGGPRWRLEVVPGVGPITARRAAAYLERPVIAERTTGSAVTP